MPSSYTLGEHFESFVKELIVSGRYASASEVIRDGLRLMEEREQQREAKLSALRRAIEDGVASGEAAPLNMSGVRAEARSRRADKIAARA